MNDMDYSDAIQKIEKKNLVENVVQQMYKLIESGVWVEGFKIASEHQLAVDFNVSRVVIREALQNLRSHDMIITRQGSGSFVCNPNNFSGIIDDSVLQISEDDFQSLIELRACVENRSIQLSVKYGTDQDFNAIHDALICMEESVGNLEKFTQADLRFHMAVVESGHSRLLIKAYRSCQTELLFIFREMNRVHESQTYALTTHNEIYQAILSRNAKSTLDIYKNMSKFNKVRYSNLFKS